MIFDDFFEDPKRAKALINMQAMKDVEYSDGVVYPNIAMLPESVAEEIHSKLKKIFGPGVQEVLSFARYSFAKSMPPHWAHSDRNIAQFLALIYLNEDKDREYAGTSCLRHIDLGMEEHPKTEFQKQILLSHADIRSEWEVVYTCPAKWNRLFVLNANLIHAAMGRYGETKEDGRLVISVFFNLAE
jgi:hypothetical protein